MSVESTHPEYNTMKDDWLLVKACSSGQREVKKLKTAVLPAPGAKKGEYDTDRYKSYLNRAIYTNITGRTKQGLTGAAFRKPPEVKFPSKLDYLNDNADGSGTSIIQLAKDALGSVLETGREGFLVDYPDIEAGLTAEQIKVIDPKATIKRYGALSIINWATQSIGGSNVLVMVVLKETIDNSENEFVYEGKDQYRVLRLRSDGYTQQIYMDNEALEEERYPTQSDGSKFPFIPFFFCGAQNNDVSVDEIPLADIAYVNIGHFRNSADLEENSFIHGQMTLGVTSNLDNGTWNKMNPNGIVVGANAGHFLGENGGFHTAQAQENQIADKLQERKEAQMLSLGAKLVEQRNPNETAAAAKIDATGESSVLSDIVGNVEEAIQRCIEWCGLFMGETTEATFEMSREFFGDSIDPQLLMAAIQGYDRSIIAKSDVQNAFRRSDLVEEDRTNEDIDKETGQASPLE